MSGWSIQAFEETEEEYAALAHVETEVLPDHPASADLLRYDDRSLDRTKYVLKRHMAWLPGREIAGYSVYHHMESRFHPQRFWLWSAVRPALQGRGIGRQLFELAINELQKLNARWLSSSARESMPHAIAFLQRRGFREVLRSWESHLYVQPFDPRPHRAYQDRLREQGVVITTLGQEREKGSDWLQALYELHTTLMADVPSTMPYTRPALETFVRHSVENPEALPDAYFVAAHDGEYIGESVLFRSHPQPGSLYQGLTAVRREYRGRGLAFALKLATIDYARKHGYTVIKTWNATVNTAMLAINDRLGFVRQPAWVEMELELSDG